MMDYLRQSGLPIFYGLGLPEEDDYTYWDTRSFPDWRQFVDVARESGARLLIFSYDEFDEEELDQAIEKLDECELDPEERLPYLKRFEALRKQVGHTDWVRIAFEHGGRWLAYERTAPWYDDFQAAMEDLEVYLPLEPEEEEEKPEEDDSGRSFFSRN